MTPQEIFKRTFNFISQQGPAFARGRCAYRTSDGKSCAVGMWLGEYYNSRMEGKGISDIAEDFQLPAVIKENQSLFALLQDVHDDVAYSGTNTFQQEYRDTMQYHAARRGWTLDD